MSIKVVQDGPLRRRLPEPHKVEGASLEEQFAFRARCLCRIHYVWPDTDWSEKMYLLDSAAALLQEMDGQEANTRTREDTMTEQKPRLDWERGWVAGKHDCGRLFYSLPHQMSAAVIDREDDGRWLYSVGLPNRTDGHTCRADTEKHARVAALLRLHELGVDVLTGMRTARAPKHGLMDVGYPHRDELGLILAFGAGKDHWPTADPSPERESGGEVEEEWVCSLKPRPATQPASEVDERTTYRHNEMGIRHQIVTDLANCVEPLAFLKEDAKMCRLLRLALDILDGRGEVG